MKKLMHSSKVTIGTRGSKLALWQSNFVRKTLTKHFPELNFETKIIKTTGDSLDNVPVSKIGDKGVFTKDIETALLHGKIDLAVHSLKDLQTIQPEGLCIAAVSKRESPNDVLISKKYGSIDDLPTNAKVATGSARRKSQLLHYRNDLRIIDIRGNVPTRLAKFVKSDLDAMILAYAGVHRLKLDDNIAQIIPLEIVLPAVGQGVMAVEICEKEAELKKKLQIFNDEETHICVTAERAFLHALEGGCQVPIGALAVLKKGRIHLEGMVGNFNGKLNLRKKIVGNISEARKLGEDLAHILLDNDADKMLGITHKMIEKSKEEHA